MARQIFRKVALERLSSPEQLDQLITITTPLGWLALLALAGLLLSAIFWGIYGSIPTQVEGQGIILRKEGIVSIQAQNSGKLTKVSVDVGDIVERGEIVARLQQDSLLEQIRKAQLGLKNLQTSVEEKKKANEGAKTIQLQELRQREINYHQEVKNLKIKIQAQQALKRQRQELKEGLERLVKDGILTNSKVLEVENEIVGIDQTINTLKLEIERVKNQLNLALLDIKKLGSTEAIDQLASSQQIEQAKLEILSLQKTFAETAQIVSSDRGRVLEVPVKEGEPVGSGKTILLLERVAEENELEVIAYFSPLVGKQIQNRMTAQISPSIVKREEFGFMQGIVSEVDQYPSTFNMVMKTLQNQSLASMLTQDTAPIKIEIRLVPDENAISGYKWSSREGPPIDIQSGTICAVAVTVKEQAPITLVIPALKKIIYGESPLEQMLSEGKT